MSSWLFVAILQGGIGYAQYFNGVPEVLVGLHIAGRDPAVGRDRPARTLAGLDATEGGESAAGRALRVRAFLPFTL